MKKKNFSDIKKKKKKMKKKKKPTRYVWLLSYEGESIIMLYPTVLYWGCTLLTSTTPKFQ